MEDGRLARQIDLEFMIFNEVFCVPTSRDLWSRETRFGPCRPSQGGAASGSPT